MDLQQILNTIGLTIGIIGAFAVFINSPKVNSSLIAHSDEETNRRAKIDRRKNKYAKYGILLIAIGFAFQLTAVFF
jgi:hypothetical protein